MEATGLTQPSLPRRVVWEGGFGQQTAAGRGALRQPAGAGKAPAGRRGMAPGIGLPEALFWSTFGHGKAEPPRWATLAGRFPARAVVPAPGIRKAMPSKPLFSVDLKKILAAAPL